jgi:putative endonuclease
MRLRRTRPRMTELKVERWELVEKEPAVYILASGRNGTLYIGVTSDLIGRISIHKQGLIEGFARRYGVHQLVHFEFFQTMDEAIRREKQLKKWPRAKKLELVNRCNPFWRDLYSEMSGLVDPASLPTFETSYIK